MSVCVCACVCACVRACVRVCMRACVCMCVCVCACVCAFVCMHAYVCVLCGGRWRNVNNIVNTALQEAVILLQWSPCSDDTINENVPVILRVKVCDSAQCH